MHAISFLLPKIYHRLLIQFWAINQYIHKAQNTTCRIGMLDWNGLKVVFEMKITEILIKQPLVSLITSEILSFSPHVSKYKN